MICNYCGKEFTGETGDCPFCGRTVDHSSHTHIHQKNGGKAMCCPVCGGTELADVSSKKASKRICFSCGTSFETPISMCKRSQALFNTFCIICCALLAVFLFFAAVTLITVYIKYGKDTGISVTAQTIVRLAWIGVACGGVGVSVCLLVSGINRIMLSRVFILDAVRTNRRMEELVQTDKTDEERRICCPECGHTNYSLGDNVKGNAYTFVCKGCGHSFIPPEQSLSAAYRSSVYFSSMRLVTVLLAIAGSLIVAPLVINTVLHGSFFETLTLTLDLSVLIPITVVYLMGSILSWVLTVSFSRNAKRFYADADKTEKKIKSLKQSV